MRTYKVELEIVLKDYPEIDDDEGSWIYRALEEQLEPTEFIDYYFIEEKRVK